MKHNADQTTWGKHVIEDAAPFYLQMGDATVWCRSLQNEIHIAYDHVSDNKKPAASQHPSEDISWSRWVLKKRNDNLAIQIKPLLPDRPVVIKPEYPFRMIKNERVKIYARVPVWIQICIADKDTTPLIDVPSVILSNTWFGNLREGELCYWISSGLRQHLEINPDRAHMAICPILLATKSREELLIEKICLRVENLTLYMDQNQLWSDETEIVFKGTEHVSQVSVSGKPPEESPKSERISAPRTPVKKSFVAKTFMSLKDLPGLGIMD